MFCKGKKDTFVISLLLTRTMLAVLSTRMDVHGQLVEPAVCFSDLYDVFLLDIVRDTRQNL